MLQTFLLPYRLIIFLEMKPNEMLGIFSFISEQLLTTKRINNS